MAKKFLDLDGLSHYNGKVQESIDGRMAKDGSNYVAGQELVTPVMTHKWIVDGEEKTDNPLKLENGYKATLEASYKWTAVTGKKSPTALGTCDFSKLTASGVASDLLTIANIEANKTVKLGLICQLISLTLIALAILLPVAPFADNQHEFKAIMGQSFRVVGASLVAYLLAQFNDVFIFHKLKEKTGGKHKWLRNNLSTMASQLIDTAIFITIAFIGVVPNIWVMIASQYLIKLIYAVLDTPFFYLLTKERKNKQTVDI